MDVVWTRFEPFPYTTLDPPLEIIHESEIDNQNRCRIGEISGAYCRDPSPLMVGKGGQRRPPFAHVMV